MPDAPVYVEILATVARELRRELEALKHADAGSEGEKQRLFALLASVEGWLFVVMRFAWALADETQLVRVRERYGDAA